MTRRVDRVHALHRHDAAAIAVRAEQAAAVEELHQWAGVEAERLHAALGLPPGLTIAFGTTAVMTDDELGWLPDAANGAANDVADVHNRVRGDDATF